jgi:uncharacterized protein YlxW (UPF0749 family)
VQTASGETERVPIDAETAASLKSRAKPTAKARDTHIKAIENALLQSPSFVSSLKGLLGVDGLDPRLLAAIRRVANQAVSALGGEREGTVPAPVVPPDDAGALAKAEADATVFALGRLEKEVAGKAASIRQLLAPRGGDEDAPLSDELKRLLKTLPDQARQLSSLQNELDAVRRRVSPDGKPLDDEIAALAAYAGEIGDTVHSVKEQLQAKLDANSSALEAFKDAEQLVDQSFAARLERAEAGANQGEMMDKAIADGDLSGIASAVASMTAKLLTVQEDFEGKTEGLRADVQGVFDKVAETEQALPRLKSHVDTVQSELLRKIAGSEDFQRSLHDDIAKCASKEALDMLDELIASAVKEEDLKAWKDLLEEDVNGAKLSANEVARRAEELSRRLDEAMLNARSKGDGQTAGPISGDAGALLGMQLLGRRCGHLRAARHGDEDARMRGRASCTPPTHQRRSILTRRSLAPQRARAGVVVQCCRAVDQVVDKVQTEYPTLQVYPEMKASIKSQFMPAIVGKVNERRTGRHRPATRPARPRARDD